MQKLNKKQKLIVFIAILLIAIILAIIITTNVINNNVGNESSSPTTANANSNLVASYIKSGITIGGITGTLESLNTFDATATPEDIIWGETAYVKGEKITGTKVVTVAQAKEANKTFETNTTLLDDYGNSVKVPAGFKIAEDSATSVTGGVVIEDVTAGGEISATIGSQFVWIPVGDVKTDSNGSITTITLGRYTFASNGNETLVQSAEECAKQTSLNAGGYIYRDLLKTTSSSNAKAKDIADFVTKAQASKGYYIGRYELGDATGAYRTSGTSDSNPVTCKAGVYPYTYITQLQASSLCQGMYSNNNFESDLINSYAWDTAVIFIQKFSRDTNYSQQIGVNTTLSFQKCGENILLSVDSEDETKDTRCNIYDMAGSVQEWETVTNSQEPCTARGGNWEDDKYNTSSRGNSPGYPVTHNNEYGTGRPILYL